MSMGIFDFIIMKYKHFTNYVYYKYLNFFNPVYNPYQTINDRMRYGSYRLFGTNLSINGEYFRSLSNNQYFAVILKSTDPHSVKEFQPSCNLPGIINYKTHTLLRLEIVKNKQYFVNSFQAIRVENADFNIIDVPIHYLIIPKFKPIPHELIK